VNLFITGTDTGIGKTFFTALLTRALRRAGHGTVALKPLCSGSREDVAILQEAGGNTLSADSINPYWFSTPVAPLVAARHENRAIDFGALEKWLGDIRAQHPSVLVEGAGGWLVPVAPRLAVADLAGLFQLPVVVVVGNRLGCLNHALLTIENIRARGLPCAGWVLNSLAGKAGPAEQSNQRILAECCDAPFLFELQPGQAALDLAGSPLVP
jgi:dethiobiotin synthetase